MIVNELPGTECLITWPEIFTEVDLGGTFSGSPGEFSSFGLADARMIALASPPKVFRALECKLHRSWVRRSIDDFHDDVAAVLVQSRSCVKALCGENGVFDFVNEPAIEPAFDRRATGLDSDVIHDEGGTSAFSVGVQGTFYSKGSCQGLIVIGNPTNTN